MQANAMLSIDQRSKHRILKNNYDKLYLHKEICI